METSGDHVFSRAPIPLCVILIDLDPLWIISFLISKVFSHTASSCASIIHSHHFYPLFPHLLHRFT